jgi:ketosteroid isomerase-like protein
MLMPTLARIGTRDSVLSAIDSLNAKTNRTLTWRPIRAELSADGTRGYTYGYGRRVARSDTLTSVVPIQYLSFWRRESNEWKLVAWLISAGGADAPSTAPDACAHPGAPAYIASHDSTAIATVRAADLDFSARSKKSGAAAAFGEFVAPDGASIGTGATEVTCGRDAVAKGVAPLGPGALIWAPRVADAAPSGDLAYTSGDATIRLGADVSYSNYLTVWKRLADGQWRVVADGGNSAPAPASPP